MKTMQYIVILFSALIMNSCGSKKKSVISEAKKSESTESSEIIAEKKETKQYTNYDIEYSATTRGSSLLVAAKNGKLTLQKNGTVKPGEMIISQKQTLTLLSKLNKIHLKGLSELKAPSIASHYDGAMAATLKIVKDGETYQTATFDHGNPPKEIEPLVSYILSMSKVE